MRTHNLAAFAAAGLLACHDAHGHALGGRFGRKDDGNDSEPTLDDIVKQLRGVKSTVNEDRKTVQTLVEKAEASLTATGEINAQVKEALEKATADANSNAARFAELEQKLTSLSQKGTGQQNRGKSLGEYVTENESVKQFLERAKSADRASARFDVKQISEATSGTGGLGDLILPQRRPGIIEAPQRQLVVRDLLSVGRTTSNSIEYVKESGFYNNAAPVAEGQLKPESSLEFSIENTPVRTIAHWIRATKQVLADIPMLQSYINNKLLLGLALEEEEQLLVGDGTGQNLYGLIPQATALDAGRVRPTDTRIDVVRRAMGQIRLAEYRATGIMMHPDDWEEIELTKTDEGSYIWANPRGLLGPTLWGLPVVDTTALNPGEFLVGNFKQAAQIWDREDAVIDLSTDDRDNFIRNLVTIRAEERLALEVSRPEAIVFGDFTDFFTG